MRDSNGTYCKPITVNLRSQDLVGEEALVLANALQADINLPAGFVCTAAAFDAFINQDAVLPRLLELLEEVPQVQTRQLRKISAEIRELFLSAPLPRNFGAELQHFYQDLAQFGEALVVLRPSALAADLRPVTETALVPLRGFSALITQLRQLWADLFAVEALERRLAIGYEGNLAQPVLVQKVAQAEISGVLYNYSPETGEQDVWFCEARLGWQPAAPESNDSDFYLLGKLTGEVEKKWLRPQKFMQIQTTPGKFTDVKVSNNWAVQPKLNSELLGKLLEAAQRIGDKLPGALKISWQLESGSVFITRVEVPDPAAAWLGKPLEWELVVEPAVPELPVEAATVIPLPAPEMAQLAVSVPLEATSSEPLPVVPSVPLAAEVVELAPDKAQLLQLLQKEESDLTLSPSARSEKSRDVAQMFPEVTTAVEVWWQDSLRSAELAVFMSNLDGIGPVRLENYSRSPLTALLETISPKPLLCELSIGTNLPEQLELLASVRKEDQLRNFWVLLPETTNIDRWLDWKRELAAAGLRRSQSFKVLVRSSSLLQLHDFAKLTELGIDGVYISLEELATRLGRMPQDRLNPLTLAEVTFIREQLAVMANSEFFSMLDLSDLSFSEDILSEILQFGVSALTTSSSELIDFKQQIAETEANILTKQLEKAQKRRRTKKK